MRFDNDQMKKAKSGFGLDRTGHGISSIVIDDEFIDRRIIVQLLRSVEFDVVAEASSGIDGVFDFQNKKPRLVVLDMHMPDTSGLDVLHRIKSIDPDSVVVMCTSDNTAETVKSLLEAGADDYIVKPIDRTQFLYKLEKLVTKKGLSS